MFKINKKGFIQLLILIIIAMIILVMFFGFAIFITLNVFTVLGFILAIAGLITIFRGLLPLNISIWLIAGGVVLVALPFLFDNLSRLTLAAVLT